MNLLAVIPRRLEGMKLLLLSDLHGCAAYYKWVVEHGASYDAIVIAGDLIDLFRGEAKVSNDMLNIENIVERLEERGVPVFVCRGNHEEVFRWPWLDARLGLFITPQLVVYCQPWVITREALRRACAEGRAEADQRQVPFLVVAHAPPALTPISGMNDVSTEWDYHAVEFAPDYCVCGHIHFAPFLADDGWYYHHERTWAFNPGCEETALYDPSHIVLDITAREARFFSSRKMARIDLDPRSGRIN